MKVKKILSGAAAAALVMSTVSIVSVVSSADEISVWDDTKGVTMTRENLAAVGVDVEAYHGKELTIVYDIKANVPADALNSTHAETVIRYGTDFDSREETHFIHCYEKADWMNEKEVKIIEDVSEFKYSEKIVFDNFVEIRFGTSNSEAFILNSVTLMDGDTVIAVYKDGKIEVPSAGDDGDNTEENDPFADNVGDELNIWSDAGLVMNKDALIGAGFDTDKYNGKDLTVTYEIEAAVPKNQMDKSFAEAVIKCGSDWDNISEKHTIHGFEALKDNADMEWAKDLEKNVLAENSTFSYDTTVKMDNVFEARFGTNNDKAFVLKSVAIKDGEEIIALYNAENKTITVTNPVETPDDDDDPNAGNTGSELDIWSDAGTVMTKCLLADNGFDIVKYEGKELTVTYEIMAAIPENAKGWTSAQTVVKYDGNILRADNEIHTIHFCADLLEDEGQDWVKDFENNIIENNTTFIYDVTAVMGEAFDVRFGTSNDKAFTLKSVTLKDGDEVVASYDGKTVNVTNPVENPGDGVVDGGGSNDNGIFDANAGNTGGELDIWSERGTVITKDILANVGVNVAAYEGKELTATYEIETAIPENAKGWTSAQTVVKNSSGESHTIHFCKELLDDEGQAWVKDFNNNVITNNSTFTYNMSAKMDDIFEVRFGTSNDKAFRLKSVTIKNNDTVIAVYNSNGSIKVENPGEAVSDANSGNLGEELDIWSESGDIMTKWKLVDAGVDIAALDGKTLTVTYQIAAAIPENAKGWTTAQTVVKYDGSESHTIHFCEELLDDEGQTWVKDFDNNIIINNTTFTYDMTAKMDDMFNVRFGTSNDKAFVLKSVTVKDGDNVIAVYTNGKIATSADDLANVNTGVEGVGVLAGVAGIAACVLVVARKKK